MKKIFAVILFLLYLTASSGATINFHYCMGKFVGWDIAASSPATCANCGMHKEQKKGCCNDKHATIELKKDQLASGINYVPHNGFFYIQPQKYFSYTNIAWFNDVAVATFSHSPPFIQHTSSYILNSVFRI